MCDIQVCSIAIPCPHYEKDKPCQFEGGQCYLQNQIIKIADKIRESRKDSKGLSTESREDAS